MPSIRLHYAAEFITHFEARHSSKPLKYTSCIDKLPEHPLLQLDQAGIAVTLNTDDPAIHRTTINDDYDVAVARWGYTLADLLRLERNSIAAAFISDKQRATLSERVNQGYTISQGQGL